ncbi:transglutaminase-like domain-containing protein [Raoultibacter phocaeensis]|uniref:transglutaminase-like domain-containing protein n=1 Tax=Raoultibacter phocaeensis TaxID=2479841 RepID=UPI0015D59DC9|nr:transglutaminase-like domain-containing protein [Raoultibacter phocaeensis]
MERRLHIPKLLAALAASLLLAGCGGPSDPANPGGQSDTSGPAYTLPAVAEASFREEGAVSENGGMIDVSSAEQGYVAASAENGSRLKFQVTKEDTTYNYDLPNDGTPLICPLNMGNGPYTFSIMQNTSGSNYIEIASAAADVTLGTEFEPFVRPNVFCEYDATSPCVAKARELAADAANQGDVLKAVYGWITENIRYDTAKAQALADATGYVPDPDETLAEGTGVCFDYASLGAAMLRSLGIPCKIITGYVSPDGIYHAWNLVYLDGSWMSVEVNVESQTWTIIDLTFAAAGASQEYVGDGTAYTERYTY